MLRISSTSRHHPLRSRRRKLRLPLGAARFLAAFEGIEGGFAIGTGIVAALALTSMDRQLLIITALITIIVSGFNSASVKYSSEHYLDELDGREKKSAFGHYTIPAIIEFICYVALSLITILPVLLIENMLLAVVISILITIVLLFSAGVWRGYLLKMNGVKDGLETALLGGGIILVGTLSGLVLHSL